jgi:DnaK suppressor protein
MKRKETKLDLADFRAILLNKRAQMLPSSLVKFDLVSQAGQIPLEDQATLLHDEFLSMRSTGIRSRTLREVDAALWRLDAGEFGVCIDCGENIPIRRLQALPWASRCVPCEERFSACPDADESWRKVA